MIINLKKDNNKLCKFLKEIFFAIFSISQKLKTYYKTIKTNRKKNNINKSIKDNNNKNKSTNNGNWNFITGELTSNNNNDLIEDLFEKEKKNKEDEANVNSSIINKIKKPLKQRFEKSKNDKELQISFLQEKFEKLNKKYKKKEKRFQIDKLYYLFRINEQNKLIQNLENKIKLNLTSRKCYPDLHKIINKNSEELIIEKNNEDKSIGSYLDINNKNKRNTFYLSHPKLNFNENSIIGKNCHNIEDIIHKNLFKLRNKGKIHKNNLKKFISLSLSETKMQVDRILNIK